MEITDELVERLSALYDKYYGRFCAQVAEEDGILHGMEGLRKKAMGAALTEIFSKKGGEKE